MINLMHGDCLELMGQIPDGSVDMILCDLPYGTTACKWDSVIPFEPLWAHYRRVIKRNGAIVLTASQPFTTTLAASNLTAFRYSWVWDKKFAGNFVQANRMPLRIHEDVLVFAFGDKMPIYFPQKTMRETPIKKGGTNNPAQFQLGRPMRLWLLALLVKNTPTNTQQRSLSFQAVMVSVASTQRKNP
jgi:site-specific DNA-methyltransferase (adenine-specific)